MEKERETGNRLDARRPCKRHVEGYIGYRPCTHDYRCDDCEFEQFFLDHYRVHAVVQPVDTIKIRGFDVPQGYYFHAGHTWAKVEGDQTVRIGLDDFAFKALGPFDRLDVPLIGKEIHQDRPAVTVYRDGHRSAVLSPLSGIVTAVNQDLLEDARAAFDHPYADGWLLTAHATALRSDLKQLMIDQETKRFMRKEVDELFGLIEETLGPMPNDGGDIRGDLYGEAPEIGWDRLSRLVFKA